jgi:hypothetical protein
VRWRPDQNPSVNFDIALLALFARVFKDLQSLDLIQIVEAHCYFFISLVLGYEVDGLASNFISQFHFSEFGLFYKQ